MATLLSPRTACLRSLAAIPRAFSPPQAAKASFTTAATTKPMSPLCSSTHTFRPAITCRLPPRQPSIATALAIRHASSAPSASPSPGEDTLTWNRFFDLRKKRRYLNLVASLATAFTSVVVLAPVVAQQDLDSWAAQISGIDPIMVLGLSGVIIAGAGWLCGPSLGSGAFSMWARRRGWNKAIGEVGYTRA